MKHTPSHSFPLPLLAGHVSQASWMPTLMIWKDFLICTMCCVQYCLNRDVTVGDSMSSNDHTTLFQSPVFLQSPKWTNSDTFTAQFRISSLPLQRIPEGSLREMVASEFKPADDFGYSFFLVNCPSLFIYSDHTSVTVENKLINRLVNARSTEGLTL